MASSTSRPGETAPVASFAPPFLLPTLPDRLDLQKSVVLLLEAGGGCASTIVAVVDLLDELCQPIGATILAPDGPGRR